MVQLLDNRCFRDTPLFPLHSFFPSSHSLYPSLHIILTSSSFHNSLILNSNNSVSSLFNTHMSIIFLFFYFIQTFFFICLIGYCCAFTITLFNPSVYPTINLFIDLVHVLNHLLLYPREYPLSH